MDLAELQKKLNTDEIVRAAFMKNPAAVMRKEGFKINAAMAKGLAQKVKEISRVKPKIPGSSIRGRAGKEVTISTLFLT